MSVFLAILVSFEQESTKSLPKCAGTSRSVIFILRECKKSQLVLSIIDAETYFSPKAYGWILQWSSKKTDFHLKRTFWTEMSEFVLLVLEFWHTESTKKTTVSFYRTPCSKTNFPKSTLAFFCRSLNWRVMLVNITNWIFLIVSFGSKFW